MNRRWIMLALLLVPLFVGCNSDKEKGINSMKDRPRASTVSTER